MDIVQYLIELLKTRKQIGIEGLGTLYKKKIPGRYDAETHSFLPPSYVLEFTTDQLENNNLVQFIHSKRGISEEASKYFISQFVAEVNNGLASGEYALENLGTLTKQDDGTIIFNQNQNIDTGFEFYALPSVVAEIPQTTNPDAPISQETEKFSSSEPVAAPTQTNAELKEPEIEQVQVPEFEQEMKMVPTEEEVTPELQESESTVENEQIADEPAQPTTEEDAVETIHEEVETVAEEELTANEEAEEEIIENEATDDEVFEEINEIDNQAYSNATADKIDVQENWDFDGDNVIVEKDIQEEKFEETIQVDREIDLPASESDEAIKLTSTTKQWDFDTVGNYRDEPTPDTGKDIENTISEENSAEETSKIPLYMKLGIALLIIVLAAALVYFIKPEVFSSFSKNDTNPDQKMAIPIASNNLKTQQDSLSFADSIMKNAEKAGLKVEPAKDTLAVTTTKTEVSPKVTYDIIAAAFAKESEVKEYIAYMKSKGFEAKVADMPGKIYKKISIASYNNIDSAEKNVVRLRKQLKNQKIYVQKIKNN
ncbi:HU-CCDC81 and SPOR domain-containing protein [Nubsella zeaxanthinifaciens]|jgi:hypothetical protein|uniref:HU-CCDC81 and SPOR domain-containing protein n=1 Tax=Nubsella zeaxanthinifaciens TaxID=392412 RepID=UPI000DE26431|nr:HU-CCDC81 and SPOR domain-containing protein [Nubsella zeaxanthinifaciens]